eukprot:TRINITY_DN41679_c0_g1_i1.p1 TRINITY_DN41679_c0_g1~~TRINITY_DN41679_c0_g1_i1.p1  ORF type:complete len:457 (+),score=60.24 TRINITY_DN41679_c0_g1_i1:83-1372(+)
MANTTARRIQGVTRRHARLLCTISFPRAAWRNNRRNVHSKIEAELKWRAAAAAAAGGDFRSDTKTQPCPGMYNAMVMATLGDDKSGECRTTRNFESFAANLLGMEAALLVASGTQGNLLAVAAQCSRGGELLVGDESHLHLREGGGTRSLFGISHRPISVDKHGRLPLANLEVALSQSNADAQNNKQTSIRGHSCVVALENTHGFRAGTPLDAAYMKAVVALCRRHAARLHVDGARLFNAAAATATASKGVAALGEALKALLPEVNTVSVCLSKGAGCPGGALLAGDATVIDDCRRLRRIFGGDTRQAAGLLAAAGLYALRERDLLADLRRDHCLMRRLTDRLRLLPGLQVSYGGTNMATVRLRETEDVAERAASVSDAAIESGLRFEASRDGSGGWRFVSHRNVTEEDMEKVVHVFAGRQNSESLRGG